MIDKQHGIGLDIAESEWRLVVGNMIDDLTLQNQIRDLALASRSEPTDGWRTEELDPKLWNGWRKMIQGDRLEIAEYDLTAKVSQGDSPK